MQAIHYSTLLKSHKPLQTLQQRMKKEILYEARLLLKVEEPMQHFCGGPVPSVRVQASILRSGFNSVLYGIYVFSTCLLQLITTVITT